MVKHLLSLVLATFALEAEIPHFNVPLWQAGKVPLSVGNAPLDAPFLTVFLPPANKRNGSAVIIAPGGSNIMLMYGVEGIEVAERFNDWGTVAFVLTYRLEPKYHNDARILDGNRSLRLVKSRAKEWGIDPNRIHFSGYSAGSALARNFAATSGPGDLNATDPIDRLDSTAHSLGMVYSAGNSTPGENLKNFPPTFLLAAAWDKGAANGSAQLFLDMNRAGGVAEIHIYQRGRHGFGSAYTSPEYGPWMDSLKHFLTLNKFFESKK